MHSGKTMVRDRSGLLSNRDAACDVRKRLTTITMREPQSSHWRRPRLPWSIACRIAWRISWHIPWRIAGSILAAALASCNASGALHAEPRHAIAMHGEPALPADFTHFRYADEAAPKGGRLIQGVLGTFESINPFIARGLVAQGMRAPLVSNVNIISGQVVESLMARSYDEPFTLYGLVARTIDTDEARSHVTFTLDPAARFSDGKPVTPQDVVFSWQLLRDKGRPNYRFYYSKVVKAEIVGTHGV